MVNLEALSNRLYRSTQISTSDRFIITALIAIAERLPQDTDVKKRLCDIVRTSKCSDYKNPSELESAVMALVDELEKETTWSD